MLSTQHNGESSGFNQREMSVGGVEDMLLYRRVSFGASG